jgi:NADH dehydrogenase
VPTAVVTGAFSNIGSAVATELVRRGWAVRTLTNRTPPPGSTIPAAPLRFDRTPLTEALHGADALVNTYWVRFPHRAVTFDTAVEDSRTLLEAARDARIARVVQLSVSNASEASPLGYYRGKARVDRFVRKSGLSWAIVHPTLVVGARDVLTNNIAWFLRRSLVFGLPWGAGYRMQPILRDDTARIVADAAESDRLLEVDAAGPEIVTFAEYVRRLAAALGLRRRFVPAPPVAILGVLGIAGAFLRDTVLTSEELAGLRDDRLVSRTAPLGRSSVFDWLAREGRSLGQHYWNDTTPRFRPSRNVRPQPAA